MKRYFGGKNMAKIPMPPTPVRPTIKAPTPTVTNPIPGTPGRLTKIQSGLVRKKPKN
jgi:hypothetical protein